MLIACKWLGDTILHYMQTPWYSSGGWWVGLGYAALSLYLSLSTLSMDGIEMTGGGMASWVCTCADPKYLKNETFAQQKS